MTATATAALDIATGYLGPPPVSESPAGSNRTIIGEKFSKLDGADAGNGVAWCAEFFSVCQIEAGDTDFQVSASCLTLVNRYKDGTNGEWLGNPGVDGLLPGDEGFLGINGGEHTFRVQYTEGNSVICIDGNWGDKVTRVVRPVGNIHGFGRPHYSSPIPEPTPTPPVQENEMAQGNAWSLDGKWYYEVGRALDDNIWIRRYDNEKEAWSPDWAPIPGGGNKPGGSHAFTGSPSIAIHPSGRADISARGLDMAWWRIILIGDDWTNWFSDGGLFH